MEITSSAHTCVLHALDYIEEIMKLKRRKRRQRKHWKTKTETSGERERLTEAAGWLGPSQRRGRTGARLCARAWRGCPSRAGCTRAAGPARPGDTASSHTCTHTCTLVVHQLYIAVHTSTLFSKQFPIYLYIIVHLVVQPGLIIKEAFSNINGSQNCKIKMHAKN